MRPSANSKLTRSTWLAAAALAIALGASAGPIEAEPSPPAASTAAAQWVRDSNPLIDLALRLGVPGWALAAGVVVGLIFFRGEAIQKNWKAWRQGLGLKPEPPAEADPPPPPTASQAIHGTENQTLQQASAGGNLTVASGGAQVHDTTIGRDRVEGDQFNAPTTVQNAQTIHIYNAPPEKRERILSTIAPAPQGVGVMGREEQLADLAVRMGEPGNNRRLVVHGESGVGKSELLREYARRHEARYPGGRYWIDCRLNLGQEIASIGRHCWQMDWLEGSLEEQALGVLQQLAKEKVLLLFDNASDEAQLEPFLPPAGQAHVLISSTSRDWGPPLAEVWRSEGLQRLDAAASIALLEKVAGAKVAQQVGARVIEELGGLPVHLLPTARTLARSARLGRLSEQDLLELSEEGIESFSIPWKALDTAARLLLQTAARWFNPNALMEAELVAALASSFQGEEVVRNAVDACREVYVLQGEERLGMHQLLVRFANAQPAEFFAGTGVRDLGPAVVVALARAAKRFEESPADGKALAALQCHQLSWDFWRQKPIGFSAEGCHHIGRSHLEMGQFAEAIQWFSASVELIRREVDLDHSNLGAILCQLGMCAYQQGEWQAAVGWYEQAEMEMRQGDLLGWVDHESLGVLFHMLGMCACEQGHWQAAAGWYQQAVAETRQGDVHGRVNPDGIGASFHQLGRCAYIQGDWESAAGWFEKAVAETCQGDLHGRVNHGSLGMSMHELGHCFLKQGEWRAAANWFEQAVTEKYKGDRHGRVDHNSLGASLHQLGMCEYEQGAWNSAARWFEQAVAEKGQGDFYGRVDHVSLWKSLHQLGNCACQRGEWKEAAGWLKKAVDQRRKGDIYGRVDHNSVTLSQNILDQCRTKFDSD